jgi:tetratricopeptide (TPR) repeat protein
MGDEITRRDALCQLASIPMIALGAKHTLKATRHEEMLRFCTAVLEGCWELSRNNDLEGKRHAYQCVCIYVPMLETIAHDSPELRMQALDLASRYAILKTLLSWVGRIATPAEAVGCAQKALALSNETGNILLQTSAYTKLTWAYLRNKNHAKAWEAIQQGKEIIISHQKRGGRPLPSGIIGNFNSSYALAQAHNGLNPDVALGIALDSEPLPGYIAFVEFTEADQHYEAAKVYCLKGDPARAIEQTGKLIETDTEALAFLPYVDLTAGVRLHAINHLTNALLQLPERDMGQIVNAWTIAMQGAQERHNEVMYDEAMANFAIMQTFWRGEQAIRQLIPLTSHW